MTNRITENVTSRKVGIIANNMAGNELYSSLKDEYFTGTALSGKALPVSTIDEVNILNFGAFKLYSYNIAAQTLLVPAASATGLNIAGDQTDDDGFEISPALPITGDDGRFVYTVGTDAPFYMKCNVDVADVSGTDELLIGFRKRADFAAAVSSYTDYAWFNINAGDIYTETRLNTGTASDVDTGENLADGGDVTLEVQVDSEGRVEFFIDGQNATDGEFTTQEFTFDDGDTVIPVIRLLQDSDLTGDVLVSDLEIGYVN